MKTAHPKRRGNRGVKRKETDKDDWLRLIGMRDAGSAFQHDYFNLRNKIAEQNYDLVLKLSELMHYKHPEFSKDDLQSFAAAGLLDAINKYDPSTGYKFETFATYRLFGSMYDEMRKSSWAPRLVRQRQAITDLHRDRFVAINGRNPDDRELIDMLELSGIDKADRVVKDGTPRALFSIYAQDASETDSSYEAWIAVDKVDTCQGVDGEDHLFKMFVGEIGKLPATICGLIYGRSMSEIEVSEYLDIDIKRVKKIHQSLLRKLKNSENIQQMMVKMKDEAA